MSPTAKKSVMADRSGSMDHMSLDGTEASRSPSKLGGMSHNPRVGI